MSDFFETLRNLFSPPKRKRYEPFLDLVEAFAERSAEWPGVIPTSGERVGILVTPWLSTAVPFFALECAEMVRRAGRIPVLLFDTTDLIQNSGDPSGAVWLNSVWNCTEMSGSESTSGSIHGSEPLAM